MTSHYRGLHRLFGTALQMPDFDSHYTIDDAKPVKQLFANNGIIVAAQPTTLSFKDIHEVYALT